MAKIKVSQLIVERGGDEMTRIIRSAVNTRLNQPYRDVDLKSCDPASGVVNSLTSVREDRS